MRRITPASKLSKSNSTKLPNLPLVLRARRDKRRHVVVVGCSSTTDTSYVPSSSTKPLLVTSPSTLLPDNTNNSKKNATNPEGNSSNISSDQIQSESTTNGNFITLYHIKDMIDLGIQELLSLAVRYDESYQEEKRLLVPFELSTIRIHSNDIYQFVSALEYLYDKTQYPLFLSLASSSSIIIPSFVKEAKLFTYSLFQRTQLNFQQFILFWSNLESYLSFSLFSDDSPPTTLVDANGKTNTITNNNESVSTLTNLEKIHYRSPSFSVDQIKQHYYQQLQEPSVALTPIILSGIIAVLKDQREDYETHQQQLRQSKAASSTTLHTIAGNSTITKQKTPAIDDNGVMLDDITSELVLMCQNMRQAAIVRLRLRKKRYQLQRIVLPVIALVILFILYLHTMSQLRSTLIQLGYVKSCDIMPAYSPACYVAEANLWFKYKDHLLTLQKQSKSCQEYSQRSNKKISNYEKEYCALNDHALLPSSYKEAPFTLHTTLVQDLITFEELNTGLYQSSLFSSVSNHQKPTRLQPEQLHNRSLRWLGESSVNKLVREAIDEYLPLNMDRHILDAGCGIGGTLYALLPEHDYHESIKNASFTYHGITSSAAETTFGRGLLSYHNLDQYTNDQKILLEQKSFEEKLPINRYSVIVAIESISFSRNVDNTISNLLRALKPGGLFIFIDDVVYPTLKLAVDEYTIRPSLFSHTVWKNTFAGTNTGESCQLIVARDLSLEYDMIHDTFISSERNEGSSKTIVSTNGGTIYNIQGSTVSTSNNSPFSEPPYAATTADSASRQNDHIWTTMFSPVLDSIFLFLERLFLAQTGANAASQRLIELQDEKYFLEKFLKARKEAYTRTIFSYNFYVCRKKK